MIKTQNKGGFFSPIVRLARGAYNWVFYPNVDHYFTDPFWNQTREGQIRRLERETVMRYSRGNVRLQNGEYITRKDMDEAQKEVEAFVKYDDKHLNQAS